MCSISCSEFDQKFRGNIDVPVRGLAQQVLPIRRWQRVPALPPPNTLFWNPQIFSELCSAPGSDNFSIAVHAMEYGKYYPFCQGIVYLYKSWIKCPYFTS